MGMIIIKLLLIVYVVGLVLNILKVLRNCFLMGLQGKVAGDYLKYHLAQSFKWPGKYF